MKKKSFRNVHIVSNVKYLSDESIREACNKLGKSITKAAYILHDKDTYSKTEAEKIGNPLLEGTLKPPHYHVVLSFANPVPSDYLSNTFGVAENFLGKVDRSVDGAFEYLIHKNHPDKYQYDVSEIHATFNFAEFLAEADKRKQQKARRKKKEAEREEVEEICRKLASGELKAYELDKIDVVTYAYNKSKIDNALNYHSLMLAKNGNNRKVEVIYITGESGSGKTTYAKEYATKKGYHYYLSGGNRDPLEGYRGEECIILDDLRGSSFKMSELLNILDNNTFSPIGSRYHNKTPEADLIIVTSILPIEEFYDTVFEHEKEPLLQLKRRCGTYIKMDRENVLIYKFNKEKNDYSPFAMLKNEIVKKYSDDNIFKRDYAERKKEAESYCISGTSLSHVSLNKDEEENENKQLRMEGV